MRWEELALLARIWSVSIGAQELVGDQWSSHFAQLEPKSRGVHPEDELATVTGKHMAAIGPNLTFFDALDFGLWTKSAS